MKKTYVSGNLSRKRFWNEYYKAKRKEMANINSKWIGAGYYIKWYHAGYGEDSDKHYIKRISAGRRDNNINEAKYLRRISNKRIRKMKPEQLETLNYSKYKRVFDYWWELY